MYFVCCKILGVQPGADIETIKAAYRKSAKELHPDLNNSEKAQEYFVILKNAYEYLLTHQYSDEELRVLWMQRRMESRKHEAQKNKSNSRDVPVRKAGIPAMTLREVLKQSRTARIVFIGFHVLFLFIGIWLVVHSFYDIFYHQLPDHTDLVSAYFAVIFGFLFGLVLTVTFLVSGIAFIRKR